MDVKQARHSTIDDYIAQFPPETQELLQTMRATIRAAAPEAQETISYGMPAFAQYGILVYFAALKSHIGLYPTSSGVTAFKGELTKSGYMSTPGAIRFPMTQPLPLDLISRITRFRVQENLAKAAAKSEGKPRGGRT